MDNIVSLPDNLYFWRCSLCGGNIHASLKENEIPAIITIKDPNTQDFRRFVFCPPCARTRTSEVDQCIAQNIIKRREEQKEITGLKYKPWVIFESKGTNTLGDKLRVIAWFSKDYGIFSAVTLFGSGVDRLVCYNMLGLSYVEFRTSLNLIKAHYESEFGEIVEKERRKKMSFSSVQFPFFRSHLIGSDEYFSIIRKDGITLRIGRTELSFSNEKFSELVEVFSAVIAFFQLGSITRLNDLKEKYKDLVTWSSRKPSLIVQWGNKDDFVSLRRRGTQLTLQVSWISLDLEIFDFIDIIKIIEKLPPILEEKSSARFRRSMERVRSDRYLRMSDLIPINHKLLMSDLGWGFDSKNFLRLAHAYKLF